MNKFKDINFRTKITDINYDLEIDYKSNLMFLGSCFTENIGNKLKEVKFNVDINPFGILYNPISVANSLNNLIEKKQFTEKDVFYFNERWNSYSHHSRFSNTNKKDTLKNINTRLNKSIDFLKHTDYLFITFGTSWIYELAKTNKVVSNCHKVPAKEFNKRILNVNEITEIYYDLIKSLQIINKNLKIIFTISPVRHLKDGFIENNISKSILRVAINNIIKSNSNCYYFPAYEILIDDLRDYRFYEDDLLHPNKTAVEYIFNFIGNSFFSEETFNLFNKIKKIVQAKLHLPFNSNSNEYFKFIKKNLNNIEAILEKNNYLDLSEEYKFFKNKKSDI